MCCQRRSLTASSGPSGATGPVDPAEAQAQQEAAYRAYSARVAEALRRDRERGDDATWVGSRLDAAGVPARFHGAMLSGCEEPVRSFAASLAEAEDGRGGHAAGAPSLLLAGETGVGKTHSACAVAIDALRRHAVGSFLFVDSQGLGRLGLDDAFVSRLKGVPLLVVDDLGNEHTRGHAHAVLFEVMKCRLDNWRPTVVTTQYGPHELGGKLAVSDGNGSEMRPDALVSRLFCEMTPVRLKGLHRRGRRTA